MIVGKLNLSKMDKARFFKGEQGTYCDICLIESTNDKFGNDYMIVQQVSKEERDKGIKGPILGNAKILKKREESPVRRPNPEPRTVDDSNVPF